MANWPGPETDAIASSLNVYAFSSTLRVLFCGTCSTPVFWQIHREGKGSIGVFTGALVNNNEKNLVRFEDHICVEDTIDGGALPWLHRVTDVKERLWAGMRNVSAELGPEWYSGSMLSRSDKNPGSGSFRIQCHCKGIKLILKRYDSCFSNKSAGELPFFIDPTTHKHLATFDACNSCRTSFGTDIINWTFALLEQIDFDDGNAAGLLDQSGFPNTTVELQKALSQGQIDDRFGTLSMYRSSNDVQRYFCSRCSATIFYAVDDRPELLDVAIGVVDAPEGARVESLLFWNLGGEMGGAKDVQGSWRERFVNRVGANAEAWRIERGYPKTWGRSSREENKVQGMAQIKPS